MKKIERKNQKEPILQDIAENGNATSNGGNGIKWLVGIDEVGRGPLAGPVAVCACVIPYYISAEESYKKFLKKYEEEIGAFKLPSLHLKDSKKLSAAQREQWKDFLTGSHAYFSYATASAKEIDEVGISRCIADLVRKNLEDIVIRHASEPAHFFVLLDGGLKANPDFIAQETIIKGDEKELVISFASIFAKVTRDSYMEKLAATGKYSEYGFEGHKGYGTLVHRQAIKRHGLSDQHRKSFCGKIV